MEVKLKNVFDELKSLLSELVVSKDAKLSKDAGVSVAESFTLLKLDGSMYLGKKVVVVGGGASAIEAVEYAVSGHAQW